MKLLQNDKQYHTLFSLNNHTKGTVIRVERFPLTTEHYTRLKWESFLFFFFWWEVGGGRWIGGGGLLISPNSTTAHMFP